MRSPSMKEKIQQLHQSLRKVLSPVPSNVATNDQLSSDDRICIVLLEPKTPQNPKTPKTPCFFACDMDEAQATKTPLDKFNALSSNLKVCADCSCEC